MARLTLFRDVDFKGGSIEVTNDIVNLSDQGFNDVISSIVVSEGTFTLYQDSNFGGFSVTVSSKGGPDNNGRYKNATFLGGRNDLFSSVRVNAIS
ncbi:MAG: beta/gamma crystallin-related protein [Waterburya sp.]